MRFFILLAALAAPILSAADSTTESEPATDNKTIEILTVTAHRLAVPNSPLKVNAIDNQRLDNAAWVGTDVLRQLPTLAISQSGALGSLTQIRAHGSEANHLLVLLDGMPLNDPANGSEYNFSSLSTTGLSGIHHLPNSASSTWGTDAIGGVINLTSKPTRNLNKLELTSGSFATLGLRGDISRVGERGYFRVSADKFQTNGTNSAPEGDETEAFESTTAHLAGGYSGDNWSVALVFRRSDIEADFDPTPFPDFTPVDGPGRADHQSELFDISFQHTWLNDRLTSELRFGLLQTENNSTSGIGTSGERQLIRLDNQWLITDAHRILLGLDFEEQEFSQSGTASFFGNPNQKQSEDRTGVALGYTGTFGPVDVDLSVRRDNNEAFDDITTYRVAAKYNITDSISVRASTATGNKNPSYIERFGFTPDTFIGNPDLKPESNQHLAAGVDFNFATWTLSFDYFQDTLEDEINGFSFDFAAGGFTAVNQNGASERDGFEVAAATHLGDWLFDFRYAHLNAEEDDGAIEIRRPENIMSLSADTSWWADRLVLHVEANYVDEQDDFSFAAFPATRETLDSYVLVNASLSFSLNEKVRLKLQIDNLTDKENSDLFGYRNPERRYLANVSLEF